MIRDARTYSLDVIACHPNPHLAFAGHLRHSQIPNSLTYCQTTMDTARPRMPVPPIQSLAPTSTIKIPTPVPHGWIIIPEKLPVISMPGSTNQLLRTGQTFILDCGMQHPGQVLQGGKALSDPRVRELLLPAAALLRVIDDDGNVLKLCGIRGR